MKMATANATIAEVTSLVTKGTTPTTLGRPFTTQGIGFIKAECISSDGALITEKQVYIDGDTDQLMKRSRLQKDDVLFSIAGVIGRTALVQQEALPANTNQAIAILRPDTSKITPKFLYYTVRAKEFQDHSLGHVVQTAQANVSLGVLSAAPIWLPSLPTQHRIAGILSAYDESIENSQRRIKILEAMARALYREWFVQFRFPGHESIPRVPSPLGDIPQGWEVKPLFALTKVNYGKNLPTKKLADDGAYPVYGAAKIIGRYTEYTREQRTIICGCRGSVGEMQITQPQCYVTNNSFTFDPTHPDNFFWLFHTLKERGLRDVVGGAAQPQITLDGISSVELVTPPLPLRTHFQRTVAAMFEQTWTLDSQIQNLRRTRDLLLPRLLSGQIDVEAMPS
jgi:type I restriction enzyme S subunit